VRSQMVFCAKCGAEIPEGAGFCPKCGTQVGALPKPERQDYSGIGAILILAGGILAIVSSLLPLAYMPLIRGILSEVTRMPGLPFFVLGMWNWIMGLVLVGALISVVLGILAVYAFTRVRRGDVKAGGAIGIIAGVILLVTGGPISGVVTIIGGVLCYTSK
jgi:ribosomal protein L40E